MFCYSLFLDNRQWSSDKTETPKMWVKCWKVYNDTECATDCDLQSILYCYDYFLKLVQHKSMVLKLTSTVNRFKFNPDSFDPTHLRLVNIRVTIRHRPSRVVLRSRVINYLLGRLTLCPLHSDYILETTVKSFLNTQKHFLNQFISITSITKNNFFSPIVCNRPSLSTV